MSTTHYQLLGLPRIATQEQIRRAYRGLAKTLHPDVNPSKDAAKKFAKLAAAYEILSNVESRRAYDRKLVAADDAGRPTPAGRAHYTWENIATTSRGKPIDISEIDDLYDTFFTRRPAKKPQPTPAPSPRAASKTRRSRAT